MKVTMINTDKFASGIVYYLGFLVAITFYQATLAHIARYKGDTSYITQTRASFVPFVHMELMGTVIFPLLTIIAGSPVVFGWPKPFNLNTRFFKNPRRDLNFIYIMSLLSIFVIGFICMFALRFTGGPSHFAFLGGSFSGTDSLISLFLTMIGQVCITIGALFLLPMPGTAGWYLLLNNIPYQAGMKMIQASFMISIIVLLLILSGLLNFYFKFFLMFFYMGATP